jgi:hypothetical protein
MEGSSSVKNNVESDFKRRRRLHERDSGKTIASPEQSSSCVDDPVEPNTRPAWEGYIESAKRAFESYQGLMKITLDTLESQLAKELLDEDSRAKGVELLESIKENMRLFISEDIIGPEIVNARGKRRNHSPRLDRSERSQADEDSDNRRRRLYRKPRYERGKRMPDPELDIPFDRDQKLEVKFPKGKTTAFVKRLSSRDDDRFEGPLQLSATLADLLKLKGMTRVKWDGTSSESDSSESDSDTDSNKGGDEVPDQGPFPDDDVPPDAPPIGPPKDPPLGIGTSAPWPPFRAPLLKPAKKTKQDKQDVWKLQEIFVPKFKLKEVVYYWSHIKKEFWVGVVTEIVQPTVMEQEQGHHLRYLVEPEGADLVIPVPCVCVKECHIRPLGWAITHLCLPNTQSTESSPTTCLPISGSSPLLPLNYVGIDTCSALSVSTQRADFSFLDESIAAKESVSLRGIGGEQSSIGGRGPMLISALDEEGRQVFMVDTSGVYLNKPQSLQLRIFSQQRMKGVGFDLVQNKYGDGDDFLVYRTQSGKGNAKDTVIPLQTDDGILVLDTLPVSLNEPRQKQQVDAYILELLQKDSVGEHLFHMTKDNVCPVFVINEGKLTEVERVRLDHWRHAHRQISGMRHEERCPACEQAKHRTGSFKRNREFYGTGTATNIVYWRLYCDGYGGQRSLGVESYQGAKGGFIFVCPVSGKIKTKLYGSTKQFPAILYQVCQEIESEGFVVREIYVDTFAVNISRAAEDVASMFKVRLIPVSSGTPQEMAYAERAVQTIAQMSRALMAGAPHLPQFCWGLSDIHANLIHDVLPQKNRDAMSPYEFTRGRAPNLDAMFIRVFGCACQYSPHKGADHKRAPKTQWGWYLGMQWPMVLILRPADNKIISVSRMKVHCHEQCYAKFDPLTQERPLINFTDFTLFEHEIDNAIEEAGTMDKASLKKFKEEHLIPKHVHSIKTLSDFNRNSSFNKAEPYVNLPEAMRVDGPQESQLGEETTAIEQLSIDGLLEEIRKWKYKASSGNDGSTTDKIIKALNKAEDEISNEAPKRGELRTEMQPIEPEKRNK